MRKKVGIGIGIGAVLFLIFIIMGSTQDFRASQDYGDNPNAMICTQEMVSGSLNERIKFLEEKYGDDLRLGSMMPQSGGPTSLKYCYPKN